MIKFLRWGECAVSFETSASTTPLGMTAVEKFPRNSKNTDESIRLAILGIRHNDHLIHFQITYAALAVSKSFSDVIRGLRRARLTHGYVTQAVTTAEESQIPNLANFVI